jgi:methylmalonyl-CoA mutase cobalamin-binding subunit
LAAHDQDEAVEIAEKELEKRSPDEVLDDVFLPVLASARRDANEGRLSDADLRFVSTAVREIGDELIEVKPAEVPPAEKPVRVVVLPAKDAVDQGAAELFGRSLDPAFWEVEVAPADVLASELMERVKKAEAAAVVIAALPPGGLTHTRYLVKRLRAQTADLKIIVGRWAAPEDDNPGWAQLKANGADEIATTIAATRTFLLGWRSVLAAESTPGKPSEPPRAQRELVGTASA